MLTKKELLKNINLYTIIIEKILKNRNSKILEKNVLKIKINIYSS